MVRLMIILGLALFTSCASYVPRTETRAKKVIRQLDVENRANEQRIQAISNTYGLSVTVPAKHVVKVEFPAIKLPEAVPLHILPNKNVDRLIDSLIIASNEGVKLQKELDDLRKRLIAMTIDKQVLEFTDQFMDASIDIDPSRFNKVLFNYTIKPQTKEETITYEQQVIDAGKEYYEHFQFWAVILFWIISILLIVRPRFLFRN
jgi:hypothetical protein